MVKEFRSGPARARYLLKMALQAGGMMAVCAVLLSGAGCREPKASEAEGAGGLLENAGAASSDPDLIENGIHVRTGFVAADGLMAVVQNCTPCHSARLVTQNRMTREGWEATIRWMQQTQNLWDLGVNEAVILDYLATYYAPENKGRRENLKDIEWYELEP